MPAGAGLGEGVLDRLLNVAEILEHRVGQTPDRSFVVAEQPTYQGLMGAACAQRSGHLERLPLVVTATKRDA
jgi:hypothetical protein